MATFLQSTSRVDSFSEAVNAMLLLVRGQMKEGSNYWAYIAIKSDMLPSFNAAKTRGMFELEDYGTILDWGKGENPPPETHAQMQAVYGVSESEEKEMKGMLKDLVEFN